MPCSSTPSSPASTHTWAVAGERVQHLLDLGRGHPVRRLSLAGDHVVEAPERLEALPAVGAELGAEVVQLLDDARSCRCSASAIAASFGRRSSGSARVVPGRVARRVDVHRLEEDQPDAAAGARLLVRDVPVGGAPER